MSEKRTYFVPPDWSKLPCPLPNSEIKIIAPIPDAEDCFKLWEKYAMPRHIQEHSLKVADFAYFLGKKMLDNQPELLQLLQAAALLHDLAKLYTIQHGGSHAQQGSAWVLKETKQALIAQGILFHVRWHWEIDPLNWPLPLLVQYADKRVKHDSFVSLDIRFKDLLLRYGTSEKAKELIILAKLEAELIEQALIQKYKIDITKYT